MNIFDRVIVFLKEVRLEMKKVNWLSRQEVLNYTLLVVGMIVAMAVYFGAIDYVFATLLERFVLGG